MKTKRCSKCREVKSTTEFSVRPNRPSGFYSSCKACKSAARSRRYRERKSEDPVGLWLDNALNWSKSRANTKGYKHDLTREQLAEALGDCCYYCDVEFNFHSTRRKKKRSPTIDRIDTDKGYHQDNIVVCCHRCNAIKSDASYDELHQLVCRLKQALTEQRHLTTEE